MFVWQPIPGAAFLWKLFDMKTIFSFLLALFSAVAVAGPWEFRIQQENGTGGIIGYFITPSPASGNSGLFRYNGTTNTMDWVSVGSGLAISSGALIATGGTVTWSGITGTPTSLSGYGITDAYPLSGNPSGFLTSITGPQVTSALGFTPYSASNPSSYIDQSGARSAISLTTLGSGAATYNSSTGVLNVPTPSASGTVTSVGVTSSNLTVTGSPITSSGSIAVSLPNVGTAGTYSGVTTDAQGRVTAGTSRTYNNNVSRALNSNYTISSTRDARMSYSINASWSLNALLSGTGTAFFEYSTDGGATWITVNQVSKTLNLLTVAGSDDMNLVAEAPAGVLSRIRTVSTNMTISYTRGQEVLQ